MLRGRGVALVCCQLLALGCRRGTTSVSDTEIPPAAAETPANVHRPDRPHASSGLSVNADHEPTTIAQWPSLSALQLWGTTLPPLSGVATGLLWSIAYTTGMPSCHAPTAGARYEYAFSPDQGPGYALYFPSAGEGFNFLPNWQVPLPGPDYGVAHYDAAMFTPDTGEALGLRECAHLVELEVNDARGSVGIHFVATRVTVLDATISMSIPHVLADLRARFEATNQQQARALDRQYQEAVASMNPAIELSPREDGPIELQPSWIADQSQLEVLIWRTGRAYGEQLGDVETIQPTRCPPGAPCAHRESGTFQNVYEAEIAYEVAARYRVDSSGVLIEEILYTPNLRVSSGPSQRRLR